MSTEYEHERLCSWRFNFGHDKSLIHMACSSCFRVRGKKHGVYCFNPLTLGAKSMLFSPQSQCLSNPSWIDEKIDSQKRHRTLRMHEGKKASAMSRYLLRKGGMLTIPFISGIVGIPPLHHYFPPLSHLAFHFFSFHKVKHLDHLQTITKSVRVIESVLVG